MIQQEGRDVIHTIESNTHCSDKSKGQEKRAVAKIHHEDIEGWGTIILSIFIGLPALWLQVSELVVSMWIDTSTWRDLPHDELYAH